MNSTQEIKIVSLDDIKALHRGYWFSSGSTRFFRSRYPQSGYQKGDKIYFITSEKFDYKTPRLYTIRIMDVTTGDIKSHGEFNELTRSQANTQLKKILNS